MSKKRKVKALPIRLLDALRHKADDGKGKDKLQSAKEYLQKQAKETSEP